MGIWRSDSLLIWDNQPNYTFHDESGSINEIGCRVELGDVEMPKKEKGETNNSFLIKTYENDILIHEEKIHLKVK